MKRVFYQAHSNGFRNRKGSADKTVSINRNSSLKPSSRAIVDFLVRIWHKIQGFSPFIKRIILIDILFNYGRYLAECWSAISRHIERLIGINCIDKDATTTRHRRDGIKLEYLLIPITPLSRTRIIFNNCTWTKGFTKLSPSSLTHYPTELYPLYSFHSPADSSCSENYRRSLPPPLQRIVTKIILCNNYPLQFPISPLKITIAVEEKFEEPFIRGRPFATAINRELKHFWRLSIMVSVSFTSAADDG